MLPASWCSCVPGRFLWPVIAGRRPVRFCWYGVDVPFMSFQLHEWGIHIVCLGTGGAGV